MLFGDFVESQSKDFKDPIDEEDTAQEYGYLSDSDLEDSEDEEVLPPAQVATESEKIIWENHKEHVEKGKVVKIPDVAYVT